jgi:hypothetical protein
MHTPHDEDAALEALEQALAAIRGDAERDANTERVIRAMEDKRAELIAARLRRTSTEHDPSSSSSDSGKR